MTWRREANGFPPGFSVKGTTSLAYPIALRITRRGDTITTEHSRDGGQTFVSSGKTETFQPPLPIRLHVGLFFASGERGKPGEARFSGLEIRALP